MGAALQGCRAPFRLVQDHSRSGRLEAPAMALRSWLFTNDYAAYLSLIQVPHPTLSREARFRVLASAMAPGCSQATTLPTSP